MHKEADATGVIYVSVPRIFDLDSGKVLEPVVKGTIDAPEAASRAGVNYYLLVSSSNAVEATVYHGPAHGDTLGTWSRRTDECGGYAYGLCCFDASMKANCSWIRCVTSCLSSSIFHRAVQRCRSLVLSHLIYGTLSESHGSSSNSLGLFLSLGTYFSIASKNALNCS